MDVFINAKNFIFADVYDERTGHLGIRDEWKVRLFLRFFL